MISTARSSPSPAMATFRKVRARDEMPSTMKLGHQAIFGELLPDVVGMAAKLGMGAVAEVRGKSGAGANGSGDLGRGGRSVADGGDHALPRQMLRCSAALRATRARSSRGGRCPRPASCQRRTPRDRAGGPTGRMRAARAVVGRDVRPFHVEAVDRFAFGQGPWRAREVAAARRHVVGRAGDHGGEEARDAASRTAAADGARDLFGRSLRRGCNRTPAKPLTWRSIKPGRGNVLHGRVPRRRAVGRHRHRLCSNPRLRPACLPEQPGRHPNSS